MSSPYVARIIAVFHSPRARPARALCGSGGACSIVRARFGVGIGGRGGGRLHLVSRAPRAARITRTHAHAIAVFSSPLAHDRNACVEVAAALARSRARGVALAVEVAVGYTTRHARRAYAPKIFSLRTPHQAPQHKHRARLRDPKSTSKTDPHAHFRTPRCTGRAPERSPKQKTPVLASQARSTSSGLGIAKARQSHSSLLATEAGI